MPDFREGPYITNIAALIGGFSPNDLGSSLLAFWDAEATSSLTLAGSLVTTWTDTKAGMAPTQATGGSKPAYSATSFNNRPGVTFDGIDDKLAVAGHSLPTGANACEIWALVNQTALAADAGGRVIFVYGGGTNNTNRQLRRNVSTSVNRAEALVGTGAASPLANNTNVDFSGIHVLRMIVNGTTFQVDVDGTAGASNSSVPGTGTGQLAIGSTTGASQFLQGVVNAIAVTSLLSAGEATNMYNFFKARGGI